MAFIEPMHRNKPNITYLGLLQFCDKPSICFMLINMQFFLKN